MTERSCAVPFLGRVGDLFGTAASEAEREDLARILAPFVVAARGIPADSVGFLKDDRKEGEALRPPLDYPEDRALNV